MVQLPRKWLLVTGGLTLLVVAAGAVFAVTSLFGDGDDAEPRANLLCVSAEDGAREAEAEEQLRTAGATLEDSYNAVTERLRATATQGVIPPFSPPVVTRPCPEGLVKPVVLAGETGEQVLKRATRQVESPSRFNVYVLVLPNESDALLGPEGWSIGPYEEICEGGVCREVSTALYISRDALSDTVVAKAALEAAFGWAATLNYPDGHPSSDDGVGKDGTVR